MDKSQQTSVEHCISYRKCDECGGTSNYLDAAITQALEGCKACEKAIEEYNKRNPKGKVTL